MRDQQKAQMLTLVKRMISRHSENKTVGYVVENAVVHNGSIIAADCEPLIGEIAQGNDSFNRQGDRISPKRLTVRGTISLNSGITGGLTQTPVQVRVLLLTQKDIKIGQQVISNAVDTAHLLEPNIAVANEVDYSGATLNHLFPVNKDLFTVYYDKTFTLNGGAQASGSVEAVNRYSVNWSKTFKKLPSTLTFDNGNGDWVNNFAPFLAIGYSYPDGSSPDTTTRRIVSTCYARLDFEDA